MDETNMDRSDSHTVLSDNDKARISRALFMSAHIMPPTETHTKVRASLDVMGLLKKGVRERGLRTPFSSQGTACSADERNTDDYLDGLESLDKDILLSMLVDVDELKESVMSSSVLFSASADVCADMISSKLNKPLCEFSNDDVELEDAVARIMSEQYASDLTTEYERAIPASTGIPEVLGLVVPSSS